MVDRIIVLAKSDIATTTGSRRRLAALWIAAPAALAFSYKIRLFGIPEITTWAKKYPFASVLELGGNVSSSTQTTVTGIILIASLCLLVILASRPSVSSIEHGLSRGVSVSLYHVGVQLATVWISQKSDNSIVQECNPRFIPRDQIIDCIITEVVLAHRIQSVVVFRLQKNIQKQAAIDARSPQQKDDSILLVNAFPGVDLNYTECAVIRSRIKMYLDH